MEEWKNKKESKYIMYTTRIINKNKNKIINSDSEDIIIKNKYEYKLQKITNLKSRDTIDFKNGRILIALVSDSDAKEYILNNPCTYSNECIENFCVSSDDNIENIADSKYD